jgi:hypothetical protein
MFFTCKQVSNHLSKEDYDKLPPLKKFSLKLHVLICPICGKYNKQVMKFQDLARIFRKKEEEILESTDPESPHLDEIARFRLKETLKQAEIEPPHQDL